MPYPGVPPDKTADMDKCIEDVMKDGTDKDSAIAICHDSIMGKTTKAGARHNKADNEMVQTIHDHAVSLGAVCSVFKDKATDRYRWVLISSSAFEDRDGEIVSQKALELDEDRMTTSGRYGPLRWWHVGEPNLETKEWGPGWDLGMTDFSAMHGRMRIESGLFYDDDVALAMKAHADELGASIGFFHPLYEPVLEDGKRVYHNIETFERSLLPRDKASNLFTHVMLGTKEAEQVKEEKAEDLMKRIGESLFKRVTGQTTIDEKAAETVGIAFKDAAPVEEEEAADGPPSTEEAPADNAPVDEPTFGSMKAGEVAQLFASIVQAGNQPIVDGLTQLAASLDIGAKLDGHLQAVSKLVGGALSTKEETEKQTAAAVAEVKQQATELKQQVDELQGNAPREWWERPERPSRSQANVVTKDSPLLKGPQTKAATGDWLDTVLDEVVAHKQ